MQSVLRYTVCYLAVGQFHGQVTLRVKNKIWHDTYVFGMYGKLTVWRIRKYKSYGPIRFIFVFMLNYVICLHFPKMKYFCVTTSTKPFSHQYKHELVSFSNFPIHILDLYWYMYINSNQFPNWFDAIMTAFKNVFSQNYVRHRKTSKVSLQATIRFQNWWYLECNTNFSAFRR